MGKQILVKYFPDMKAVLCFVGNPKEMYMPPMEFLESWESSGGNKSKFVDNLQPKRPLRALILTPTRELAIQVKNHLEAAAKYTVIKVKRRRRNPLVSKPRLILISFV